MPLVIEAPTDAQLDCIAALCADRGLEHPAAIYSKLDASQIIDAILRGYYDPFIYSVVIDNGPF